MNRRRELIHARCSCSEQLGRRRRRRRGEGRLTCDGGDLAAVKGSGGGTRWLRRRSFFFSPLLRCAVFFLFFSFSLSTRSLLPFSLTVAQGRGEERTGGGSRRALRVLRCCGGSSSSRCGSSPPLVFFSRFCSVPLLPLWFCWRWQRWWWRNGGAGWWWPKVTVERKHSGGAQPGGEEWSFFFSVQWRPVSVLLFPLYAFAFSPLSPPKTVVSLSVSPLLLLVAAAVGDAAGDKAKWRWRSFQRWRERNQRERWVTVLLPYSFVFLFFPSILSSAQVFPSLFFYPSLLLQNFAPLRSSLSQKIISPSPCFLCSPLYL